MTDSLPCNSSADVPRRYVDVDGRAVHYRVVGEGPAVVMLHDSPRSSRLHLDTMHRLSHRFRVYALDTPGYGNSDPLDLASPTIGDFAGALNDALEALGLSGCPLYATHTSAKIALEYAAMKAPAAMKGTGSEGDASARASTVILDGLSIPVGPPDAAFISAYMRPFQLDNTGAYLAAEWSRMRDMLRWFPWFAQKPEARMPVAIPSDEWISDYMIDFLSAGPAYSSAYSAAMYYDPMPALRRVACNVLVAAKSDDVLYSSLERVPVSENPSLTVERLSADREEWLAWLEHTLAKAAGTAPPSTEVKPQPERGPLYVDLPHGPMRLHRGASGGTRPLLILSAPTTMQALAWQAALPDHATLVPELPGYGESASLPSCSLEEVADALVSALDQIGTGSVDVLACSFATPLAEMLAARHTSRVCKIVLDGSFRIAKHHTSDFIEELCPTLPFDIGGGHIHRYWHMLRDGEASWPWFDRSAEARRSLNPNFEARALHDALLGILKQPHHYGDLTRAACTATLDTPLPVFEQATLVFDAPGDRGYSDASAAANRVPHATLGKRSADLATAAQAVTDFLSGPEKACNSSSD